MKVRAVIPMENENIYKIMYLRLFNAVTDAVAALEQYEVIHSLRSLKIAQQDCEEIFISAGLEPEK